MQQKHLFVMDPIDRLNLKLDSSIRMAFAVKQKGDECFYASSSDLFWRAADHHPAAKVKKIEFSNGEPESVFFSAETEILKLSAFRNIFMRKDPPYDMEYLSTTWLLQEVPETTRIANHPRLLQSLNEKLSILRFPKYSASALVSSDSDQLLAFIKNDCQGNAVLKPLDLFGGRGVEHIQVGKENFKTDHEIKNFIDEETQKGRFYRIAQPFNEKIYDGEVRVFTLAGEPISWTLKVPAKGEFLANTRMGAILKSYVPTSAEEKMVRDVAGELYKKGGVLIGFDLIGGQISEINVTSPRLLLAAPSMEPYHKIAAWACD